MTEEPTCPRCGSSLDKDSRVWWVRLDHGVLGEPRTSLAWDWTICSMVCERCGREIERAVTRRAVAE